MIFKSLALREQLRVARRIQGETSRQLAERLGVKSQFIDKMERGQRKIPVRHMATVFEYIDSAIKDINPDYLDRMLEVMLKTDVVLKKAHGMND